MFRPVSVRALPGYKLWVKYSDGIEGEANLSHLVGKGVFSLWNDYGAFQKVYIGEHGEIAWSEERVDSQGTELETDIFGETAEEIRADEEQWNREYPASRDQLRVMAREAAAEYRAGRTSPMEFAPEGRLAR